MSNDEHGFDQVDVVGGEDEIGIRNSEFLDGHVREYFVFQFREGEESDRFASEGVRRRPEDVGGGVSGTISKSMSKLYSSVADSELEPLQIVSDEWEDDVEVVHVEGSEKLEFVEVRHWNVLLLDRGVQTGIDKAIVLESPVKGAKFGELTEWHVNAESEDGGDGWSGRRMVLG